VAASGSAPSAGAPIRTSFRTTFSTRRGSSSIDSSQVTLATPDAQLVSAEAPTNMQPTMHAAAPTDQYSALPSPAHTEINLT